MKSVTTAIRVTRIAVQVLAKNSVMVAPMMKVIEWDQVSSDSNLAGLRKKNAYYDVNMINRE
jgi:hypothetical protein